MGTVCVCDKARNRRDGKCHVCRYAENKRLYHVDGCPFCEKPKGKDNKRCQACRTIQQREALTNCGKCGVELTDENWPKNLQKRSARRCRPCSNAEQKNWRGTPEQRALKRRAVKIEVMSHYGGKCACCGETEMAFLTIDHVNGDGAAHRREIKAAGGTLYRWLQKNGYPQGDYQCLCMNCNFAKSKNFWGCPHEVGRLKLIA